MTEAVVVAGATGRVGHRVAERLLSTGREVRVVGRDARTLARLAAEGAQVRVGSFQDQGFFKAALRGATAAFVLTPLDISLPDLNAEQRKNVESVAAAIRESDVRHVVLLSSWGAEVPERIGGVIACRWFEQALEGIEDLNAVYLRPVWFMENFLWNIGLIKAVGVNGLAINSDVSFPLIATPDIAAVAAEYLETMTFSGRRVHYLNGPRDYTMAEVTRVLGAAIDRPGLKYVRLPDPVMRKGLIGSGGLSPNAADLAIEINHAISTRRLCAEPRSALNTTTTTLEEFARTTFAPAYRAAPPVTLPARLGGAALRFYLAAAGHLSTR
jgi:uncharacterized protein YbjT (DUF2867 family)